ncbi:MAG: DUF2834 domain-containing protein [Candidatus Sericytochromatia bacterium]
MQQQVNAKTFRLLLLFVLLGFFALTAATVAKQGFVSVLVNQFQTLGGIQVFVDLAIMCGLFSVWMYHDAQATGRKFLPWFAVTLAIGSFGPLLYLITAPKSPGTDSH